MYCRRGSCLHSSLYPELVITEEYIDVEIASLNQQLNQALVTAEQAKGAIIAFEQVRLKLKEDQNAGSETSSSGALL